MGPVFIQMQQQFASESSSQLRWRFGIFGARGRPGRNQSKALKELPWAPSALRGLFRNRIGRAVRRHRRSIYAEDSGWSRLFADGRPPGKNFWFSCLREIEVMAGVGVPYLPGFIAEIRWRRERGLASPAAAIRQGG